jgi:hypothetical protein
MKKILKLMAVIFCSLIVNYSFSQNSAKILAPNYTSASNPLPTPLPFSPNDPNKYNGLPAKSSQNIQMDASGQKILFFTIDEKVYDLKGNLIGLLMAGTEQAGYGAVNPSGELLIVPASTCGNEFYIFGTFERSTSGLKLRVTDFMIKLKSSMMQTMI